MALAPLSVQTDYYSYTDSLVPNYTCNKSFRSLRKKANV